MLSCLSAILKVCPLKCVPGAGFNISSFQTVGSIKQVVFAVLLQNGHFNRFTAGVVKAAFPDNTYSGSAIVYAQQQLKLLGYPC
jgi:hypothetical protein